MTADVWLPIPPDEIEGLPEGLNYRFWDGAEDFPADPAHCAYYVVPYMKPVQVGLRPVPRLSSVQVVQTLSPHRRQQASQALSTPLPPPLPLLELEATHTYIARYARVLAGAHQALCRHSHRDDSRSVSSVAQALHIRGVWAAELSSGISRRWGKALESAGLFF